MGLRPPAPSSSRASASAPQRAPPQAPDQPAAPDGVDPARSIVSRRCCSRATAPVRRRSSTPADPGREVEQFRRDLFGPGAVAWSSASATARRSTSSCPATAIASSSSCSPKSTGRARIVTALLDVTRGRHGGARRCLADHRGAGPDLGRGAVSGCASTRRRSSRRAV